MSAALRSSRTSAARCTRIHPRCWGAPPRILFQSGLPSGACQRCLEVRSADGGNPRRMTRETSPERRRWKARLRDKFRMKKGKVRAMGSFAPPFPLPLAVVGLAGYRHQLAVCAQGCQRASYDTFVRKRPPVSASHRDNRAPTCAKIKKARAPPQCLLFPVSCMCAGTAHSIAPEAGRQWPGELYTEGRPLSRGMSYNNINTCSNWSMLP